MPRADHRAIRRAFPASIPDSLNTTTTTAGGDGNGTGNHNGNGQGQQQTSTTTSATSVSVDHNDGGGKGQHQQQTSSSSSTTTSTTSHTTQTTTSTKDETTKQTSSQTSASVLNSVLSSSTISKSAIANAVNTNTKPTAVNTYTPVGDADAGAIATTSDPVSTISGSSTPVSGVGSINVGAVIGGVAGGIAALAVVWFICMWFIRRRRDNNEVFDPVNFRKSAVMVSEDPFNPRPPTMIERKLNTHNVAPSISSFQGANMAGAGAYSAHGHGSDEGHQYNDTQAYAQHANTGLQPRQNYTFGQSYTPEHNLAPEEEYNGAYSAEPQAQDIYAAEAYAYPGDGQVVVSPGMHSQEMGHYQQHTHDAYGGM